MRSQLFPASLSSCASGAVGVGRLAPHAALVAYADGGLGAFAVQSAGAPGDAQPSREYVAPLPLTLAGSMPLAGLHCLSSCALQSESLEHYNGLFAVAHAARISIGTVLVDRGRAGSGGALEASASVVAGMDVEGAGRATCLHVDKDHLAYGTADGGVFLQVRLDQARAETRKFSLASGRRARDGGPASGPQCHAVSVCWYASDIVVAAGCVALRCCAQRLPPALHASAL
jgi:hypothetical protein